MPPTASRAANRGRPRRSLPAVAPEGPPPIPLHRVLAEEVPQPPDPGDRLLHHIRVEGERLPVVAGDQVGDDCLAPVAVERLVKLEDVALRLRHLLGVGLDHPVVHPGPGEGPPRGLGLGHLVLVVGEDEVGAAAVDRELGPELGLGHRRALDVPAGPSRPPGRVPGGVLVGLLGFPEGEVERILLERGRPRLLALVHVLGAAIGEPAVAVEAPHLEVDVAARLVGVAAVDQLGDQLHDLADRLARERLGVGASEPEPVRVLEVGGRHPLRELRPSPPPPRAPRRRSCR